MSTSTSTKRYAIKEIFLTLQGEGFHAGTTAIFCRFSGCNLWSGKESARETAACRFCDTDFVGTDGTLGGRYNATELVEVLLDLWSTSVKGQTQPMVVFTGGEPLLQLDAALVAACKEQGIYVAIETNGTKEIPAGIDWVCLSPKPRSTIVVQKASELKLIYPQPEPEMHPNHFATFDAKHRYLQPLFNENIFENRVQTVDYCIAHPIWKLSIQMQKILDVR